MNREEILIVDDDPSIREIVSVLLAEKGFRPLVAGSAEEGMVVLNGAKISVALVDLVLPGMGGLELLSQIKGNSPDTEVVMMTSHASLETAIEAIRKGAYDYLRKPFEDLESVRVTVQRALDRRSLSLRNRELLSDLKQRNRELSDTVKRLSSLIKAGRAMSSIHSISELLDFFIGLVTDELKVDRASLMLLDKKTRELRIAAWRGISEDLVKDVRVKMGEGIAGWVAQKGKPILVKDVTADPRVQDHKKPNLSNSFISSPIVLSIPIKLQEKVLGVINATNKRSDESFDDNDMAFLYGLAGQAAVAIENAGHFEELEEAYQSLKSSHDQVIASERLKALGQMAAGVAHDFNNILNNILGRTQLLLRRLNSPDPDLQTSRSDLEVMEQLSLEGAETVKRIQDFTGIRKDRPKEAIDFNEIVRKTVEMTRPKWKDDCEARGICIEIRLDLRELPPTAGNEHELTQVISNLIFNAVEAMPHGGSITLRPFSEKDSILFEVEDTGVGIKKEIQGRLFEPFFTTKEEGRGLGLSIANGIVKRYRGEISVSSQEASGSTFRVQLPVLQIPSKPRTSGEAESKKTFSSAWVLIIEDDPRNRRLFEEALGLMGHHVVAAPAGKEGLKLLRQGEFDVVITDLSMPGLSGWEVAKGAKDLNPKIPVILLSGWGVQQDSQQVKEAGIDIVLSKPCGVRDLQQAVHEALQIREKGLKEDEA